MLIEGIGASSGIQIGKVYKYNQVDPVIKKSTVNNSSEEIARFQEARLKAERELLAIKEKTKENINEETALIFGAHIEILNDPELSRAVESKIFNEHINAGYALKEVADTFISMFEKMDNEYLRERATDIKDVTKRVQAHIQEMEISSLTEIKEEVILVAKDLTPSDTAQLNKSRVKGFITNIGGRTSHSAIMARTLEIPAVVGTKQGFEQLNNGDIVIITGIQEKYTLILLKKRLKTIELKSNKLRKKETYGIPIKISEAEQKMVNTLR